VEFNLHIVELNLHIVDFNLHIWKFARLLAPMSILSQLIWTPCLTCNVEVVGSSPIKGPHCFPWARNFTLIA